MSQPAVVGPCDDEAAIGKRGDVGHLLTALRDGVDHKLAAELVAIRIQDLRPDRIVGWVGISLALILPDDGKVAVGEFHDPRIALILIPRGIDLDLSAGRAAVSIETPQMDGGILRIRTDFG